MENPIFVYCEHIPLVTNHDEDDYDDYNTPNTSRVNETISTQINYQLYD